MFLSDPIRSPSPPAAAAGSTLPTPPSTHTITRGGREGGSAGNAATALFELVPRPSVRSSVRRSLSPLPLLFECSKTAAAVFWTRSLARPLVFLFHRRRCRRRPPPDSPCHHARRAAPARPPPLFPLVWRLTVIVKRAHAHTRLPPSRTRTQRALGAATTPLPPPPATPPPPPIWRGRAGGHAAPTVLCVARRTTH